MGYTTDFSGSFKLDKPLSPEQVAYLQQFAGTRRFKRKAASLTNQPDPLREAVGLPVGDQGGYYVGEDGDSSSGMDDYNSPPKGQPGLWCQWMPTNDGTAIEWDGGEKFYNYVEWLEYIIEHFLKPWGYVLNGKVEYQGEEPDDRGTIHVRNNQVKDVADRITSPEPDWDFDNG